MRPACLTRQFRRHAADLARSERGATLLEFALAAMLFFTVIFGTLEFGYAIWQYNLVAALAQDGARWASVRGFYGVTSATAADVQDYVRSRAYGLNVTVTTSPEPRTISTGQTVTVTVSQDFTIVSTFLPTGTIPLRAQAQMVMSR